MLNCVFVVCCVSVKSLLACCVLTVCVVFWQCVCCVLAVCVVFWQCVLSFGSVCCVLAVCVVFWLCVLCFGSVCCVLAVCVVFWLCVLCFVLVGHRMLYRRLSVCVCTLLGCGRSDKLIHARILYRILRIHTTILPYEVIKDFTYKKL